MLAPVWADYGTYVSRHPVNGDSEHIEIARTEGA